MKDIKFRAFHKPSKKMFGVYCFTDVEVMENSFDGVKTSETLPALREDCILMQYTGLKDCEGKEIFEGDIIEVEFDDYYSNNYFTINENEKYIGEIVFDYFGYYIKFPDMCFMPINDVVDYDFNIYYKILGNIHQNSELLMKNK